MNTSAAVARSEEFQMTRAEIRERNVREEIRKLDDDLKTTERRTREVDLREWREKTFGEKEF
jgi:hypothetical protein